MTKGTEVYGRVANIRMVGERDLQDGNIGDDWRGNRRDEEQDGCDEEKGDAHPRTMSDIPTQSVI